MSATFLGIDTGGVERDESFDRRFEKALVRLRFRCDRPPEVFTGGRFVFAMASHRPGNLYLDDDMLLAIDGNIDNLPGLHGARDRESGPGTPASSLADLIRSEGIDILTRLHGGFAISLVDLRNETVTLVRDRFGTKPMLYLEMPAGWCWGSDMKTLLPFLDRSELDAAALAELVHFRWLVGDRKLIHGIRQLSPASMLTLGPQGECRESRYWSLTFHPDHGAEKSLSYWSNRVDRAMNACYSDMAARYARAGILLSGGVDSSILAAKAGQHFSQCVAITPFWPDGDNPELEMASNIARHLGMEHLLIEVDNDFIDRFFPQMVWLLEQPPRHYSSIPMARALAELSGRVDCVLYGEAADPLFGNAPVRHIRRFARRKILVDRIPRVLRQLIASTLANAQSHYPRQLWKYFARDLDEAVQTLDVIDSVRKEIFSFDVGPPRANAKLLECAYPARENLTVRAQVYKLYTMTVSHFEEIDRMATPLGLDIVNPFISDEVLAVARSLPPELLVVDDVVKPVLKHLGARYFPEEWMHVKKYGFETPTPLWLSGPLRRYVDLLREERSSNRGLFDQTEIARLDPAERYSTAWLAATLELFMRQFVDDEATDRPVEPFNGVVSP